MFETLVGDEEAHFDEFDKQLDNIKRFGPNYLALQSFHAGGGAACRSVTGTERRSRFEASGEGQRLSGCSRGYMPRGGVFSCAWSGRGKICARHETSVAEWGLKEQDGSPPRIP